MTGSEAGPGLIGQMRQALTQELAPLALDIGDDSAQHAGHAGARGGGHFRVRIVSERFRGRSALQRHRQVYAALASLMGTGIHALSIDARTPEEEANPDPSI